MKMIVIAAAAAALLSGCVSVKPSEPTTAPVSPILRLTTEEILRSSDGDWIVVSFPRTAGEPVVIKDQETGQWIASAKVSR